MGGRESGDLRRSVLSVWNTTLAGSSPRSVIPIRRASSTRLARMCSSIGQISRVAFEMQHGNSTAANQEAA